MLSLLTRIAIAIAALVVIDSVRFADPDLFVTLYSGREIVAHHGPPGVDTASFTVSGQPWNDYEWLARLVFYEVATIAGDRGLVMLRLVLAAAILATVVAVSRRSGGGAPSLATAIALFTATAGGYLIFRPTLFTFLALVLLLTAVERLRQGAQWPLWAIPVAIPLWANLHAGFALGVVLLFLLVTVGLAERWIPVLSRTFAPGVPWTRSLPCFLASAALSGVHPLGYRQWGAILGTVGGTFTPSLSEWRPLTDFGFREMWPAYLLMVVVAVAMIVGRKRIAAFDVASALLLGAAAFVRVRFVPLFALCATLVLVQALPALGETACGRRFAAVRDALPRLSRATATFLAILALGIVAWRSGVPDLRIRKIPYLVPVSAVKFLEANRITGRILTEYDWGGYVRWKIPDATIFVDGRSDTVYPLAVIEDWARFVNALGDWRDVPARYGAQVILLRRDQSVIPSLEQDAGWIPAYSDPFASVFVRDAPENAVVIEALRAGRGVVPVVRPEDYLGL